MNDYKYPWCNKCDDNFPMRKDVYNGLEECGNTFYCPQGHSLMISRKSIVLQFRSTKKRCEYKTKSISRLTKSNDALLGVQTRQRNRLLRGGCPYCKTMPHDMVKHIKEQHGPKVR